MKYRFKIQEKFEAGARRIAAEQLSLAERHLVRANHADTMGVPVHEARKSLKRVRALLRLLRPCLAKNIYQRENAALRDIGRELSGPRDRQVMIDTLAKLRSTALAGVGRAGSGERGRHAFGNNFLGTLSEALVRQLAAVETAKSRALATPLDQLKTARHRWRQLQLREHGFSVVGLGLEQAYAHGRQTMTGIYLDASDEAFHELRKHVQFHWRHLLLLERAWPEALTARAKLAKDLSQILGDDHDMSMLAAFVSEHRESFGPGGEADGFIEFCRVEQRDLRRHVEPRALLLFAEEPEDFRQRIRAYWAAAVHTAQEEAMEERDEHQRQLAE